LANVKAVVHRLFPRALIDGFHVRQIGLYSILSGQPDYGDKRAEIGGSDPGAMPGGSTSFFLIGEARGRNRIDGR